MDGIIGIKDGMFPYKYVVATLEPCDITERVDRSVADYIMDNGLMDEIIDDAVDILRDYYELDTDVVWDAIEDALLKSIGSEKLDELEEEEA